jgi:benzylsuccinate CoA-transferase BbsF subunit
MKVDTEKTRPLSDIRVLDFSWSVAGPTMTRYLASLGAEVIKVEWPTNPDPMRSSMFLGDEPEKNLNNGSFFANLNIGKRSFTLNVRSRKGAVVMRDLIRKSDVVTESFSASVLERWGLGFEKMQALNPGIIYASISGFGHTGPYRNMITWGPTAQAMAGTTSMSGIPGEQPAGWGWSYLDVASGYFGAIGVLSALYRRKQTGKAVRFDLSQVEVGMSLVGPSLLDCAVNGRTFGARDKVPGGNLSIAEDGSTVGYRGDRASPHNVYATREGGPNGYCAIAVRNETEWNGLKKALGNPAWCEDPRFDSAPKRASSHREIDEYLRQWMKTKGKYEAMAILQADGVPAAAVQSARDLVENDPQIRDRGLHASLEHPRIGRQTFEGLPFRSNQISFAHKPRWPILGQDNDYVLSTVLGYSRQQIEDLLAENITWPKGMPENPKVVRSLW